MMLTLRIRKAEVAMADGRLDEAYQQAIRDEVRDHRRGQKLIGRLAKAFHQRGVQHLKAGNAAAALADADRATRLGGNQPNLLSLRDDALAKIETRNQERNARHHTIDAARRCIASGDFSLGAQLCDRLDKNENTVVGLMQDAELNRRQVETAIQRGQVAVKGQQWETALDALAEAKRLQPRHADVASLQDQVSLLVVQQIRSAFAQGRLDQAASLLVRMNQVAPGRMDLEELTSVIDQSRRAAISARSADVTPAVESLKSLKVIIPEAKWLDAAIKEAEAAARSVENLRTGPLGLFNASLLAAREGVTGTTVMRPSTPAQPAVNMAPLSPMGGTLPSRFVIHVDGAGSFLVMRGRQTTIGVQSRSRPVDVEVLGNLDCSQLIIERSEEDYFLTSEKPVVINGKPSINALLANRDEIRLGRRGSMKFTKPCAASTSAVIEFRGVRLAQGNARKVLLMDDSLVLGPQPSAHVQVAAMERSMVIHSRGDQLYLRPMSPTAEGVGVPLVLGRPNDLDGLSLVVAEVA